MPRLLPIDLVNAQFSKASFGGYRHDEVNELVDR
ncbi:MAG: DivIVA domain-containing protein, partial [Nostoc sp.]